MTERLLATVDCRRGSHSVHTSATLSESSKLRIP